MIKSILLIAPLTFLISCSVTSEIYDDAYNSAKAPPVVKVDEETGYADYIKKQENLYPVEVDSSSSNRSMNGINPGYYGQEESYGNHQNSSGQVAQNYNGSYNSGYNNGYRTGNNCSPNNYNGWAVCQYSCQTFYRSGSCWHTQKHQNDMSGNYYPYGSNGWGYNGMGSNSNNFYNSNYYGPNGSYYYGYYNPNNLWGNGSNGCNNNYAYNGYYGDPYGYNNNYGYGGYNNSYGYGNGYGNGWGYGLGGWGYNYNNNNGNGWGNGNNNNNNNNDVLADNHHFGHRGGSNSGSHSQNNTTYEHTVKAPVVNVTPFPAFSSKQEMPSNGGNPIISKPSTIATTTTTNAKPHVVSNGSQFATIDKPVNVNTNTVNDKPGTFGNAKPVGNQTGNNVVATEVNKPAINTGTSMIVKGTPANNQFTATGRTYTGNSQTSSRNGGTSNRTYVQPDKYGNQQKNSGATTTPYNGTTYSGKSNSSSRRTYNSGSSSSSGSSGGSSRNSGSSGSSSGNSSSGSSSRSSSSGSSSKSSGSSGSSSGSSSRRK